MTARARRVAAAAAEALEAGAVGAAIALARALGPAAASGFGGAVARAIGPMLPASRVAHANLRLAMPELDHAARRRIVRGAWDNLGRTVAELPHLPGLRPTGSGPGLEVENDAVLRALAAAGGPVIFMSGHIGNWEVMPPLVARYGMAMSSVYRAAGNGRVDARLSALRARAMEAAIGRAVPMFPKGAAGARGALRHLAAGGHLGLLMDQKLNDGIPAPFFGREAMTAPSLAALAIRFRCPVVPGRVRRVGPARLRLVVEPPLALPPPGMDRAAAVAMLTTEVNRVLERWIRAEPEGWLWFHRRWPRSAYEAGLDPGPGFGPDPDGGRG